MARRTREQPRRTILRRWRDSGVTFAELECDHIEPVTGLDLSTAVRCQQCNPIMRTIPTPSDGAGW